MTDIPRVANGTEGTGIPIPAFVQFELRKWDCMYKLDLINTYFRLQSVCLFVFYNKLK
jgi:hypothetical protein